MGSQGAARPPRQGARETRSGGAGKQGGAQAESGGRCRQTITRLGSAQGYQITNTRGGRTQGTLGAAARRGFVALALALACA